MIEKRMGRFKVILESDDDIVFQRVGRFGVSSELYVNIEEKYEEISSPPLLFSPITKVRKLGSGSFGNVHEIRLDGGIEVFAGKEIRLIGRTTQESVLQESKIQHKLSERSSYFPKVIGVCVETDSVTIVMEKVDTTLDNVIRYTKDGIKDWAKVKELILQLLEGASDMHAQDIAHFDIKPANIGINRDGNKWKLKYLDFSADSARYLDKEKKANPFTCTPEYSCPEYGQSMLDEKPIRGDKADTWSLGCTVLHMVTKHCPFDGCNLHPIKLVDEIRKGLRPTIPSEIDDNIKIFIRDCFEPEASRLSPKKLLSKYRKMLSH
jgi:mitogen-activated protein kinase kinase kinase 1